MSAALIAATLLVATRLPMAVVAAIGLGFLGVATAPAAVVVLAGVAGVVALQRRLRARTRHREQLREDAALLADLTVLGLTGGLGIRQALEIAAGAVGGEVADEVAVLLRRAQIDRISAVLAGAGGAGRDLYRVIGRSVETGASLLDQATRVADDMHAALAATRLERVRKLPVAMLFPLTLLILPGFLLLTVAPAIVDAFLHLEM